MLANYVENYFDTLHTNLFGHHTGFCYIHNWNPTSDLYHRQTSSFRLFSDASPRDLIFKGEMEGFQHQIIIKNLLHIEPLMDCNFLCISSRCQG
jgi:hypothetical protein